MRASIVSIVSLLAISSPALGGPISDTLDTFEPMSRTAEAITGAISISTDQIVFENGVSAGLRLVNPSAKGMWTYSGEPLLAQIFEIKDTVGVLLNNNTLCGEEPSYLVVYQSESFGSWNLSLDFYNGSKVPIDRLSPGMCSSFSYILDGRIEDVENISSPDAAVALVEDTDGKWQVKREINPIDDTTTVTALLVSDGGVSSNGNPVRLVARCKSGITEAFIIWGDYVGNDSTDVMSEWKYVIIRIGNDPANEQQWLVSTDRTATFAPYWAGGLINRMLEVDRLVAQMTPYGEVPITAVFDVRGVGALHYELVENCT